MNLKERLNRRFMKIGTHDTTKKVVIVAEIGNNHEGEFTLAKEMIHSAAEAGADAVKFQTFVPELLTSSTDSVRLERLRRFQLSYDQFAQLAQTAEEEGVAFFSTPLDIGSARFLNHVQSIFKIASGDNTFFPLIERIAEFGKSIIVSAGFADIDLLTKVRASVHDVWRRIGVRPDLAFLHCVSSYPTPIEQANLGAISTLKGAFPDCVIGYSDHTLGIEATTYAVAAGARIIEKHFTLDKHHSDFRDHKLSADPTDLRRLVETVRRITVMMGDGKKVPQRCEEELSVAARRSIAAMNDIPAGKVLAMEDITWVRPGDGIQAGQESSILGHKTAHGIKGGELIRITDLVQV